MITEYQEIARYRVADRLRAAEARAQRNECKPVRTGSPRRSLAVALHRLADRLEPGSRRLAEPRIQQQSRHRGTGLSVVR